MFVGTNVYRGYKLDIGEATAPCSLARLIDAAKMMFKVNVVYAVFGGVSLATLLIFFAFNSGSEPILHATNTLNANNAPNANRMPCL